MPIPTARSPTSRATISWGDVHHLDRDHQSGTRSGGFEVNGSHTYTRPERSGPGPDQRRGPRRGSTQFYTPSNLISDGTCAADHIDPNLMNPWVSSPPATSPFVDRQQWHGRLHAVRWSGNPNRLVVTIPGPEGEPRRVPGGPNRHRRQSGTPSGRRVPPSARRGHPAASFIFDTEDGTISAWNPGSGRHEQRRP